MEVRPDLDRTLRVQVPYPKGPCTQTVLGFSTQIVYRLVPKYLSTDSFNAKVYTIWAHGPVGGYINPKKLEIGLRTKSAGIPYTLRLRIEANGFPTFRLLL